MSDPFSIPVGDEQLLDPPSLKKFSSWYAYIVQAENGSLYVGCSSDPEKRFKQHRAGTGAKFFRTTRPVRLLWVGTKESKSQAHQTEAMLKRLRRERKLAFLKRSNCPFVEEVNGELTLKP